RAARRAGRRGRRDARGRGDGARDRARRAGRRSHARRAPLALGGVSAAAARAQPRAGAERGAERPEAYAARADAAAVGSGAAGARVETHEMTGEEGPMLARLVKAATAADSGMELYAGACVGGSTVVNDALCWRPPPEVLARWQRAHGLAGLTETALAPYVDRVWTEIGAAPTGRANLSRNARLLARGAARLGWAGEAMHRNVRGCANLGLCNLGCPTGAKQSALVTWVPRAERAGARVVAHARVERIAVEAGRARGVEGVRLDPASGAPAAPLRVDAPLVVLAAGVLETPALLLRSGLAAGDGLQFHSSAYVTARFAEPVL